MEPRVRKVWNEVLKKRYIASRIFARKVGLGADDKMAGFEVTQSSDYLHSVEREIKRDQYSTELK